MKFLFPLIILFLIFSCKEKTATTQPVSTVSREDLSHMKWIEGNWEGDYHGRPFYETYTMVNDSTLRILTYNNIGTDSTSYTEELISWKDGAYYMGEGPKYKVVMLEEGEIKMVPVNASNEIYWKKVDDSTWAAELAGKTDTTYYILRKVSPTVDTLLMAARSKFK